MRGEIVPDKDLQHLANLMLPTMGLKKAPDIRVLKKMAEYKNITGPSASVFHAPAFFMMQDELEMDEQRPCAVLAHVRISRRTQTRRLTSIRVLQRV